MSKTFPGQRALIDVTFDIAPREVHALVGENGSGKSTLIKILAGFHDPDPGSWVRVRGEDMRFGAAGVSRQLGMRFVHQDLGLIDELTVAENVGLGPGFATKQGGRINWEGQRALARRLLARINVEVDVDQRVADLRPVERTAVAIARALDDTHGAIHLLVLDEPTAALPPAESEALFRVIRDVVANDVSVLYVSHRLDEILHLAQHITVLRDGRCEGTVPREGLDRARLVEMIVGHPASATLAEGPIAEAPPAADTGVFRFRGVTAEVLDGMNLDIAPGEIVGVAGLTGSGREEVAAALTGAKPAGLRLDLPGGRQVTRLTPALAKRLGIVLVLPNRSYGAAIGQFSVRENITLAKLGAYAPQRLLRRAAEERDVAELVEALDIRPPDPDRLYSFLSGGNKQKVLLAKWFNLHPRVVVLDDPTSGVDVGARQMIYQLIRRQAAAGAAAVICSSDLEDLVEVCDRVVVLVSGTVTSELRGDEITAGALLEAINRQAETIRSPG